MKITVKTLGGKFEFESQECTNYSEALTAFERLYSKSLDGMDLFVDGAKVKDLNTELKGNTEFVAVKSKHESA